MEYDNNQRMFGIQIKVHEKKEETEAKKEQRKRTETQCLVYVVDNDRWKMEGMRGMKRASGGDDDQLVWC